MSVQRRIAHDCLLWLAERANPDDTVTVEVGVDDDGHPVYERIALSDPIKSMTLVEYWLYHREVEHGR